MYTFKDGRVAFEGRTDLTRSEVDAFVRHALTRSYRKRGIPETLMGTLFTTGYAEITWRFRHRLQHMQDLTFDLTMLETPSGHVVFCTGDMCDWALQRVNHALGYAAPPTRAKRLDTYEYRRMNPKRGRDRKREKRARVPKAKPQKKCRAARSNGPFTAPLALAHNKKDHSVVRHQFKKQRISWKEMVKSILYIFEVRGNWKYTAEQLVGQEIWRSFHASGRRFVQYKRGEFTLRFDLALGDGRWRGDITPLLIAATKDNKNLRYRRMRDYFGGLLVGCSPHERSARKGVLGDTPEALAG